MKQNAFDVHQNTDEQRTTERMQTKYKSEEGEKMKKLNSENGRAH